MLDRRSFLGRMAAAGSAVWLGPQVGWLEGAPAAYDPRPDLIPAPEDPADWPAFWEGLAAWRRQAREGLRYDDRLYRQPEFAWAARCFSCCFLMVCDETFYDFRESRYCVREFLDHGEQEFGGYDAVVLWHAYPRIGTDERNQFDFYRDLPGGWSGLRDVVREFQERGVKVFLDYNPWDRGTRREEQEDPEALARLVQAVEADGLFLDTLDRGAETFRARLDAARAGVVLEGELALPLERVCDHHLSWAQWFADRRAPGVLRNKWFERRHLQHQIRRWDRDHTGELHTAWMNGSGMMVWENVFGSWIGWSPRDRSILRSMLPVQRRYAELFCGEAWTPLVPSLSPDVYVSLWEGDGLRLFTVVNRSEEAFAGELFWTDLDANERWADLIRGEPVSQGQSEGRRATLVGRIPPRGIGGFLCGRGEKFGGDFGEFMKQQRLRADRASWSTKAEERLTILKQPVSAKVRRRAPRGMASIAAVEGKLVTELRVRECGFYASVPPAGHRLGSSYEIQTERFERPLSLGRYAIDVTPVTNARFAEFLRRSGFRPRHLENFLRHWARGHPPVGQEDHPVVYVSLEDARAYATWAGKRLPTEEEWQYAAAGEQALRYPWGNEMLPNRCNDGASGRTTPVRAFPSGKSPFGVLDLCGNVWEWTESERSDGRTRFVLLKGGCWYRAQGSNWYFDGGPQPNQHSAKFLLMWPGLDRCATVGFRCALDLRGA